MEVYELLWVALQMYLRVQLPLTWRNSQCVSNLQQLHGYRGAGADRGNLRIAQQVFSKQQPPTSRLSYKHPRRNS